MTISPQDYANTGDSELLQYIKTKQWDKAMSLVNDNDNDNVNDNDSDNHNNQVAQPDEYNNLPLHAALGFQAPDDLILTLLHRYPNATAVHGTDDWLPLHIAAMYGCSSTVLQALIETYPQALDDRGQFPSSSSSPSSDTNKNNNNNKNNNKNNIKGRTPRHFAGRFEHNRPLLERSTEEWQAMIAAASSSSSSSSSSS
ncbi:hypothetical protein ACA910_011722 [Epithemia clementina (nom. ined.)]